jgi:hypothetical protein
MSFLSVLTAITAAASVSGQAPPPQERPEALTRLVDCQSVADSAARLTCYDAAAAALESAEQQGEVVILDRARVNETRRQLFGFNPTMPSLFRGEAVDSVESTLQSASRDGEGRWLFRLADGAAWRQIDYEPVRFTNRPGQAVRVRKAAMGSFLLTVGNSRAVRVRRQ